MPGREHLRGDQTLDGSRRQDQKQAADQMFSRPWSASQRSQLPPELPPAAQSLHLLPPLPSPKHKRGLVLEEGVEPPRPFGPRDFESRASASSATPATRLTRFYMAPRCRSTVTQGSPF